jgi:ribosomal protein L31
MIKYNPSSDCVQCEITIEKRVYDYSIDVYRHPLCRKCQTWFADILEYSTATDQAIDIYFALRQRGVPAILEKSDGFKTIDIAVPQAKMNIEVDGGHHNYSGRQAMSDLKRSLHSFKKGYYTLHIPNSLAKYDLEETADLITQFLVVSRDKKRK